MAGYTHCEPFEDIEVSGIKEAEDEDDGSMYGQQFRMKTQG